MYCVYIIQNPSGKYYIGYTSNIFERLAYHNSGMNRSTKDKGVWSLVYTETFETKTEAIKREKFLKRQKSKEFYSRLISGALGA